MQRPSTSVSTLLEILPNPNSTHERILYLDVVSTLLEILPKELRDLVAEDLAKVFQPFLRFYSMEPQTPVKAVPIPDVSTLLEILQEHLERARELKEGL